jgi:DNA-binding response OmpR family regulator
MHNILIADDSAELLEMIKLIYSRRNFLIATARSRDEVFSNLDRIRPDLIFLDVLLNKDDGREICWELKSRNEYRQIPVILMSGNSEKLSNYKEVLADDIIEKPFSIETILLKVKALLGSKKF